VWGGRTDTGADCSGFLQAVFAIHGIALPRDSDRQAEAGVSLSGPGEPLPQLESGDLVFFAPEGEGITHVAISTGETGIIHSSSSNGAVAENDLASNGKLERMLRRSVVCATRPFFD
jgi:cell wall-associated NlpC family hydrolase